MKKPNPTYIGDAATQRFLERYRCPTPFHVVRMRFWGEIVGPSLKVSPIAIVQGLWPDGLPEFEDERGANDFFQTMLGLWNRMARFQGGSPGVKLTKVGRLDTRESIRNAANLRVEELLDGFLHGFMSGGGHIDVPADVGDRLRGIEKSIKLLAGMRNTFDRPPGPDDAAMTIEFAGVFPEIDRVVHAELNAIAASVRKWRKTSMG